jgi:hypothetical protein
MCTDTDGVGSSDMYARGLDCKITVTCPTGMYAAGYFSSHVGYGDYVIVNDAGTTKRLSIEVNTVTNMAYYFRSATGGWQFTSNSIPSMHDIGATMTLTCRYSRCPTYNTATTPLYNSWGGTNLDLIRNTVGGSEYGQNVLCVFRLSCPDPTYSVYLQSITGAMATGDVFSLVSSTGTVLFNTPAEVPVNMLFPRGEATLRVTSAVDMTFATGPTIASWTCLQSQCSSNRTTYIVAAVSGTNSLLLTDTDGAASTVKYMVNEFCEYTINCPGDGLLFTSITGRLASVTDYVWIYDNAGTLVTKYYASSATAATTPVTGYPVVGATTAGLGVLFGKGVEIRFTSDAASGSTAQTNRFGITVGFKCLPTRCNSPSVTNYDVIAVAGTATATTDTDGSGAALYTNREHCIWPYQCPSDRFVKVVTNGLTQVSDTARVVDPSTGTVLQEISGSLSSRAYIAPLPRVNLTFTADAANTASGITSIISCSLRTCSATNPAPGNLSALLSVQGIIRTDADGNGTATSYQNEEYCQWIISCPKSNHSVRMDVIAGLLGTGDYIYVLDSGGRTKLELTSGFSKLVNYTMPAGVVTVRFLADVSGTAAGVSIYYTCLDIARSPPTPTKSVTASQSKRSSSSSETPTFSTTRQHTASQTVPQTHTRSGTLARTESLSLAMSTSGITSSGTLTGTPSGLTSTGIPSGLTSTGTPSGLTSTGTPSGFTSTETTVSSQSSTRTLSQSSTDQRSSTATESPTFHSSPTRSRSQSETRTLRFSSNLRTANSIVEIDALLEIPSQYMGAPDQLDSPIVQAKLRADRSRLITLDGDSFDPTQLPQALTVQWSRMASQSLIANDISGCLVATASRAELLRYVVENTKFVVLNSTTIAAAFLSVAANTSSPATKPLTTFRTDELLTIQISPACVQSRHEPTALTFRFRHISLQPSSAVSITTQRVVTGAKIVLAASGGGTLAVTSSRSTVVLSLFKCEPEFYDPLEFMDNPFQLRIGPAKYGYFLAASMLNHLLIYGIPLLHAFMGFIYSKITKVPLWEGFVWARFPSLSLLPLQYFVETTATSAMVTAVYAEENWHRAVAVISLAMTFGLVVAILIHLLRSWAAEFVPGQNPITATRGGKHQKRSHAPEPASLSESSRWKERLILYVEYLDYLLSGGVTWKDADPERSKGYCRANRLLFMDYRPSSYWFMTVELGVAAIMGLLQGVRMGLGQCTPIGFTIVSVLVLFLLAIVLRCPYSSLFEAYFNIAVTALQVIGATFAVMALLVGGTIYQERCEQVTVVGLYMLIGKAIVDLIPQVKRCLTLVYNQICAAFSRAISSHVPAERWDLAERLMETIQEAHIENDLSNLFAPDHGQAEAHDPSADELLPELELEDDREELWLSDEVPNNEGYPERNADQPPESRGSETKMNPASQGWFLDWDPSEFATLVLPGGQRRGFLEKDENGFTLLTSMSANTDDHRHAGQLHAGTYGNFEQQRYPQTLAKLSLPSRVNRNHMAVASDGAIPVAVDTALQMSSPPLFTDAPYVDLVPLPQPPTSLQQYDDSDNRGRESIL